MLFEIEELFGVRLGEEDVLGVETVGDLCTKVRGLLG
jgi:acyl carrier protein